MRIIRCGLVALSMLAAGAAAAQDLSRQADPAAGRLRGGRAGRHRGALVGDKLAEAWGKPVIVENVTGARRQCRDRSRRQGGARRLHAARRRLRDHRHQSEPLSEAPVRSGEGLRADHADPLHAEPAGGAGRPAGEERGRARRLCARAIPASSPSARPASAPRSISPASCSRPWRASTSSTCPIAASRP